MPDLSDDIARIAALRGKPVNYFTERADERRSGFEIKPEQVAAIFMGNPDSEGDIDAYDHLPVSLRRYVSEATLQLNAARLAMLSAVASEERIVTTIEAHMPGQVRAWVLRHYGRDHPSFRRAA